MTNDTLNQVKALSQQPQDRDDFLRGVGSAILGVQMNTNSRGRELGERYAQEAIADGRLQPASF